MTTFGNYDIEQMPLSLQRNRRRVEQFLAGSGLRLDDVDYYAVVTDRETGEILAGGGYKRNIIKCLAVSDRLRGTGMSQELISHLIALINAEGYDNIKVFTKPSNTEIFTSMGFRKVGSAPQVVLLENGVKGIDDYCKSLLRLSQPGFNGAIVMNANPFTLGHRYLVEQAAQLVDNLYVIVVEEDLSFFRTSERLEMVKRGVQDIPNVKVCTGGDYVISAATFPSYFIKEMSDAAKAQMQLDLNIFTTHIAPALGVSIRFVGTEPTDELTRAYNEEMSRVLSASGIKVVEVERLEMNDRPVSASNVRGFLQYKPTIALTQTTATTWPLLVGWMAWNALVQELNLEHKPGLVTPGSNGAHSDMNYNIMLAGANALRPYFMRLATAKPGELQSIGIEAERAMLQATGGVNTHRGALFALGLAVNAAVTVLCTNHDCNFLQQWSGRVGELARIFPDTENTHGAAVKAKHGVGGALTMARGGYSQAVDEWVPFMHSCSDYRELKTLLLIMSQLDDTNVIHRAGYRQAQQVKQQARELVDNFSIEKLDQMNKEFINANISPGGAADMLALTIFLNNFL